MFTLYTLGRQEGDSLYCGMDGLSYGGLPLVGKSARGLFEPFALSGFFKSALQDRAGGLRAVATALNKGEFALAAICAVHLRLPALRRNEIEKLAKTGYNPDEPRVPKGNPDGGQWTNGDNGSNDDVPSDAFSYQAGDGTQFYAPPDANFFQVYASGISLRRFPTGTDALAIGIAEYHGGLFDYQRSEGMFYRQYADASNYGVGVLMNGAGYNLWETKLIASGFSHTMSSNAGDKNQEAWWKRGWEDAEAGRWR